MPGMGVFLTGQDVPDETEEETPNNSDTQGPERTQREAMLEVVDELVKLHEKDSSRFKPSVTKELLEKRASFNKDGTLNHWDLSSSGLRFLPESFGGLVMSGYLLLNHNQLLSLPESIGNLCVGRYLDLSDNQLMKLPAAFGDLKVGGSLSLAHNFLTTLPASFGQLRICGDLMLHHNRLESLPDEFDNLHVQGELKLGNARTLPAVDQR